MNRQQRRRQRQGGRIVLSARTAEPIGEREVWGLLAQPHHHIRLTMYQPGTTCGDGYAAEESWGSAFYTSEHELHQAALRLNTALDLISSHVGAHVHFEGHDCQVRVEESEFGQWFNGMDCDATVVCRYSGGTGGPDDGPDDHGCACGTIPEVISINGELRHVHHDGTGHQPAAKE